MEVLPKITTRRWRVSVLSELANDRAVVTSMLNILQSSVAERWRFVEPEHADFLLLGTSMSPPLATTEASPLLGRFVDPEQTEFAGMAFTIQRPLRAMPFLDLLSDADAQLRVLTSQRHAASMLPSVQFDSHTQPETALNSFQVFAAPSSSPITDLMASSEHVHRKSIPSGVQPAIAIGWLLHGLRKAGASFEALALVAKDGSVLASVSAARAAFTSPYGLPELLPLIEAGFRRAELRPAEFWAQSISSHAAHPLDLLCWHVGKLIALQSGLAPWLNREQSYRLVSWPDFGTIGSDRVGFKLAASMARRSFTITEISEATATPEEQVVSFLNSASLCGLLVSGAGVQPRASATIPAESHPEKRTMLARLRFRLGL